MSEHTRFKMAERCKAAGKCTGCLLTADDSVASGTKREEKNDDDEGSGGGRSDAKV